MNFVPLALYAVAFLAYAWHFTTRDAAVGRTATTLLVLAALAHTFVIGMQTMEDGQVPVAGATSAISTFVWLLALAYLYTEMTTDERAMGVFILPLLLAFQAIPAFRPEIEERHAAVLQGPLFGIHVSSLLFAYASFALACVIGITYVLQFKEIKAKHLGFFYARLPSLQVLDRMNQRAIVIGWAFLTIGVVFGAMLVVQARVVAGSDPRVQAMSLGDPKIFVALVCWAVYSFELFAARRIGWGGRRMAYLSAFGFAIVLLNFVPVSYFLTTSHNF
jgi:ABC-type transport system involved in cytochrome c biogenesis permease subunit